MVSASKDVFIICDKKPLVDLTLTNLDQTLFEYVFEGIEAELRAIQYFQDAQAAASWWARNFAHKYPDYRYDAVKERIVKRKD